MTRRFAPFVWLAASLAAAVMPASDGWADEVSRAVDRMGWKNMYLESCDPDHADVRLKVQVKSEDLKKHLLDLALRAVQLQPQDLQRDAVFIAPVIIAEKETDEGRRLIVEIVNATRRSFDLRIRVREGGLEMAKPSLDETFTARWTRMQDLESEELKVTITMIVGPRNQKPRTTRPSAPSKKEAAPASAPAAKGGS